MPTKITIITDDHISLAQQKIAKLLAGTKALGGVSDVRYETVELHRPQQVTIDPEPTEVTRESLIGMLPLQTKTLNALRHAHTGVRAKNGKVQFTNIVLAPSMNISTVGQLMQKTEADLLEYFDIGPKRIAEIKKALQKCNPDFVLAGTQNSLPLT